MGKEEMSLKKEAPNTVTILQATIFFQFSVSFFIVVLTTVGISFDYPVVSFYLMALLQVVVAVPGVVHIALQGNVWVAVYISFQLVTAVCETYWLVYMIFDNAPAQRWIGLAALLAVNTTGAVVAIWFRQKTLVLPFKKKAVEAKKEAVIKKDEKKPEMKVPSTSMMSESEEPKRSSKESSSRSTGLSGAKNARSSQSSQSMKRSKSSSSKSMSSVKKSPRMPVDSRESAMSPQTSGSEK